MRVLGASFNWRSARILLQLALEPRPRPHSDTEPPTSPASIDYTFKMMRDPRDPRRFTPSGELRQPKYVRFHPLDDGLLCDEIFWEGMRGHVVSELPSLTHVSDPNTYTPREAPDGRIQHWGLFPASLRRPLGEVTVN